MRHRSQAHIFRQYPVSHERRKCLHSAILHTVMSGMSKDTLRNKLKLWWLSHLRTSGPVMWSRYDCRIVRYEKFPHNPTLAKGVLWGSFRSCSTIRQARLAELLIRSQLVSLRLFCSRLKRPSFRKLSLGNVALIVSNISTKHWLIVADGGRHIPWTTIHHSNG